MSDEIEVVEVNNEIIEEETYDFDKNLEIIYQEFSALDYKLTTDLDTQLKVLITHPKEDMDSISYFQVMFMEGMKYDQQDNKNAARYCAMRMLWMSECYTNRKKKRPRFLDFVEYEIPEEMKAFMNRYTDFLSETYAFMNRRLLIITAILFFVVFLILTLFLQFHLLISIIEAFLLGFLNYILQKRRMPDVFQKNQTNAIDHYVDADVLEFDRPIRYS